MCVCVCVCERERERESGWVGGWGVVVSVCLGVFVRVDDWFVTPCHRTDHMRARRVREGKWLGEKRGKE